MSEETSASSVRRDRNYRRSQLNVRKIWRSLVHRSSAVAELRQQETNCRRSDVHSERGDVPGWVLITLMTTALVVAIWALAGPALTALFEQAMSRVSGL